VLFCWGVLRQESSIGIVLATEDADSDMAGYRGWECILLFIVLPLPFPVVPLQDEKKRIKEKTNKRKKNLHWAQMIINVIWVLFFM
jgi:hypothetical protein